MSRTHTAAVNRGLRECGEQDARAGKKIEAFFELKGIDHTERNRGEYEIGYRAAKQQMLARKTPKDYELITGVFQVHSQRNGGEVLCVPQRCKLYSNLSRGAAIPKIREAVATRYGVSSEQVKFWFWATGVSIPGNDVLCQFERDQVVTAKY